MSLMMEGATTELGGLAMEGATATMEMMVPALEGAKTALTIPDDGGVREMENDVTMMLVPAVEEVMDQTTTLLRKDRDSGRQDVNDGGSWRIQWDHTGCG